jgi:predicted acyl esterase
MAIGGNWVREVPDMGIVLSDGTRLSARVWMPGDAARVPVPAILEFCPIASATAPARAMR